MPAPSPAWTLIRITGHFRDYYGAELNGTVTFTPTVISKDTTNNLIVLPTLPNPLTATVNAGILYGPDLVAGILLPATNDPDINPINWVYNVTESLSGAAANSYSIPVPHDAPGGTLDLADIVPAVATTTFTSYALASTVTPLTAEATRRLDFYDYGAIGDGSADDTAAVQAAFNAVVDAGIGVPAAMYQAVPGTFKLTSQINIVRKALIVKGAGVGNPTAYGANPGKGTTFQWAGATGGYPFRIVDSEHVVFQDILFQGNVTNPPGALVRCYNDGSSTVGTNAYISFIRCRFGRFTWSNVSTPAATLCATAGIIWDGTNSNNDQFVVRDCVFDNCGVGIDLPNSQSIWGQIENCFFDNATVAGIRTSAGVTLINAQFNACAIDVLVNSTAKVTCLGHNTENSTQIVKVASYGMYAVYGGKWLFASGLATNFVDCAGSLVMSGVEISEGAITGRKLYVHEAASGVGVVDIRGVIGLTHTMLDVQAASAGSLRVKIDTADIGYDEQLRNSQTITTLGHPPRGELLASGECTFERRAFTASPVAQTSGTITFTYFTAGRTETINSIAMTTSGTAAAGLTLARMGVYSVGASGDLTLVQATASDTNLFIAANTEYTRALAAAMTKTFGQIYAVALLCLGTTMPTMFGDNAGGTTTINTLRGLSPKLSGSFAGQTDLPSSVPAGSIGGSRNNAFARLIP